MNSKLEKDENKVLVMLKSRHLTMIDTTSEPKPAPAKKKPTTKK